MIAAAGRREKGGAKLPAAKPEAVDALKDAARSVRLGSANYERALERIRAAEQLDPNLWEAFYDEGWILLKLRNPGEAIAPLEKALAILPANAATVQALGEAYLLANRPTDAVKIYRAWLERPKSKDDPHADQIRVALGAAYRRAGKLDEAIDALQKALRIAPRQAMAAALDQLGLVYKAKGQLELADLVLHRALEIDDKSKAAAETWNNLGLVALERRRDQEAFAHFEQATKLDPSLTVARRNKAAVYLDCGDYTRAVEELKHVTRVDPDDVDAWIALGVAERGAVNLQNAEHAFQKALELDPDAADALYDLGRAADGLRQTARPRARRAREVRQDRARQPPQARRRRGAPEGACEEAQSQRR